MKSTVTHNLAGYISPGDFSHKSEQIQGATRGLQLLILEEKKKQTGHQLTAAQKDTLAASLLPQQANNKYLSQVEITKQSNIALQKSQVETKAANKYLQVANEKLGQAGIALQAERAQTILLQEQKAQELIAARLNLDNLVAKNLEQGSLYQLQNRLKKMPTAIDVYPKEGRRSIGA